MLAMTISDMRLGATISSKEAAIRAVGEILVGSGSIDPEYVESMLAREKTATTFLGNGLAIPHGRPQDSDHIRQTRVAVLQIPSGVSWQDGKTARLVFGIAAKSDERMPHVQRPDAWSNFAAPFRASRERKSFHYSRRSGK